MLRTPALRACLCMASILLSACASPQENFYTLSPATLPTRIGASDASVAYSVSVGPVRVPEIVDRPQFVIRQGANRVELVEQHRWAQSLRIEIARVLAAGLARQLPQARITFYNDAASQNADYRVAVDIEQFDAIPGEAVTVQAIWTVRRAAGSASKTMRSTVREPVRAGGYDELAAAYSRALSAMSVEIANAVSSLQAGA